MLDILCSIEINLQFTMMKKMKRIKVNIKANSIGFLWCQTFSFKLNDLNIDNTAQFLDAIQ